MPRQRYRIYSNTQNHAYFITCTTIKWLPVFTRADYCQVLVEAWEHYRQKAGLKIFAWVILDNHIHAILSASDLQKVLRGWKSFTAKRIIDLLKQDGQQHRLNEFRDLKNFEGRGTQNARVNGQLHQLWQSGYHPQIVDSDSLWDQKADYTLRIIL